MSSFPPSPTERRYLVGLKAPQHVAEAVDRLKSRAAAWGFFPDPFDSILPLYESERPVPPPVPGLLPPCESPVLVGETPLETEDGEMIYLPMDSGGWFGKLKAALIGLSGESTDRQEAEASAKIGEKRVFYPELRGVPIAFAKHGSQQERIPPGERTASPRWRTLLLECLLVEWAADRPWYMSTAWTVQWRRRLRRAPSQTNNDKHSDIA